MLKFGVVLLSHQFYGLNNGRFLDLTLMISYGPKYLDANLSPDPCCVRRIATISLSR